MKHDWIEVSENLSMLRVGDWVLAARREGETWIACIDRPFVSTSAGHPSREVAQDAAEALLDTVIAPFLAAARAQEREACWDEALKIVRAFDKRAEACTDARDEYVLRKQASAARDVAHAIDARKDGVG